MKMYRIEQYNEINIGNIVIANRTRIEKYRIIIKKYNNYNYLNISNS